MSRTRFLALITLLTVLCASAPPASAAARFFGFVPRSAKPVGISGANGLLGVDVPDAQQMSVNPGFNTGFMLPDDYERNSLVKIRIYAVTAEADCGDIVLNPMSVLRSRPGTGVKAIPQDGGTFSPVGGSPILTSALNEGGVIDKLYRIRRGSGVSLKAGDALTVAFERDVLSPDDTCDVTVFITGVQVQYRSE
jgi:hypothetical protein